MEVELDDLPSLQLAVPIYRPYMFLSSPMLVQSGPVWAVGSLTLSVTVCIDRGPTNKEQSRYTCC